MKIAKKHFLFAIVLVFFSVAMLSISHLNLKNTQSSPCNRCNVILIDIDILRADALPCYGYKRNTAPNLCAFAEKSVIFDNNFSTSYWTLSDTFSVITSLLPSFHHIKSEINNVLPSDVPTMAESLQKNGYKTIFIGPNMTTTTNEKNRGLRGYDLVINNSLDQDMSKILDIKGPWFIYYHRSGLHMPYQLPDGVNQIVEMTTPSGFPVTSRQFDLMLDNYLRQNANEVFTPKSLKLYSSILQSPSGTSDANITELFYSLRERTDRWEYLIKEWPAMQAAYIKSFDKANEKDVSFVRMLYDTKIKYLDNILKPIYQKLDSESFSKNTITLIMSNHGEAFGEHGTFSHDGNNYHSEIFKTPLIIRVPGYSSKRVDQTTSNLDIFPSIMDLLGLESPLGIQGISIIPYINNEDDKDRRFVAGELQTGIVLHSDKWVYFLPKQALSISETFLFDKTIDPQEKINVVTKYPDLSRKLFTQAALLRSYGTWKSNYVAPPDKTEKTKILQKEGYF